MIRMNEREFANLNVKHMREEKSNPQYPGVKTISVTLEEPPIIIEFTIRLPLPSVNVLKGGNDKGNYHIRRKLQQEWLNHTAAALLSAGYRKKYHLKQCTVSVVSYYSHHKVECQNLHTKGIWDALIGRIYDNDNVIETETKSSKKCKKGEERTHVTIIG